MEYSEFVKKFATVDIATEDNPQFEWQILKAVAGLFAECLEFIKIFTRVESSQEYISELGDIWFWTTHLEKNLLSNFDVSLIRTPISARREIDITDIYLMIDRAEKICRSDKIRDPSQKRVDLQTICHYNSSIKESVVLLLPKNWSIALLEEENKKKLLGRSLSKAFADAADRSI